MRPGCALACAIFLLAVFSGCATMSKSECVEADWYDIGYRDGFNGLPRAQLDRHREACSDHGIVPDREAYYRGRDIGLDAYCRPERALELGLRGAGYNHVCPPGMEAEFLTQYQAGRHIYEFNQKITSVERRLKSIEQEIHQKEDKLLSAQLSDAERNKIRAEILTLDREHRRLSTELLSLEKERIVETQIVD
jgi:Protein of unknown function (DUF2799)